MVEVSKQFMTGKTPFRSQCLHTIFVQPNLKLSIQVRIPPYHKKISQPPYMWILDHTIFIEELVFVRNNVFVFPREVSLQENLS